MTSGISIWKSLLWRTSARQSTILCPVLQQKWFPSGFSVYHVIFLPTLTLRYSEANTVSKMLRNWAYKSVKLQFLDYFAQSTFFKHGLRVGYEIVPVNEFKDLPKCCFKCRSLDNLQNSCPSMFWWTSLCLNRTFVYPPQYSSTPTNFFLAVRVGSIVFINSYLPYEGYSIRSLTKFAKACGLLKNLVNQVLSNSLQYIIIGDLNTDINRSSVRSDSLF